MTTLGVIVTSIAIVLGVVPAIVLWLRMADSLRMGVQTGLNDDDAAVHTFISVVNAAKDTLIVHDDGNEMEGTVYNDEHAISAVRRQLEKQKNLKVRFLFNEQAKLKMVDELRSKFPARVEVRYMRDGRPQEDDIHYKIADAGIVGHLSDHEHGHPERHFKLFDCSATSPRSRIRVFGEYIDRFERDFELAFVSS